MEVQLILSNGSALVFTWSMDGLNEGLAIGYRSGETLDNPSLGTPIDVTDNEDWSVLLQKNIVSIKPVRHIPNDGCPEMPWAFRLQFSNGADLVIALGESENGNLIYLPDALLVIFDETTARSYKIPASSTSSFG
ncbi:hypothetical protein [Glycomyces buryatensis]|uniref:Uncharacterized protein n=1 Tax=Glycomyces buryatensis TaxID=2570927 RepID=A0A4S8Q9V0_9ACTN|nr:hypothetical protein [Glycomyces buryatensis]THV41217.1 hypothetical protein FAB82_12735 [Glycomyces buryatensis]